MKLVALMPVRNEDWCLGLTARAALMWADELVILNHASTDESVDIIEDLQQREPARVHVISVPDQHWDEMNHRQMMLERARAAGATHIGLVDADEILTGNLIKEKILGDQGMLQLPGYNLRGGTSLYHANGIWSRRWFSFAFKDDSRLGWHGDKFHQREPGGMTLDSYRPIAQGAGGIMHLWGANERRLRAKHALYKVTERLRWPEKPVQEIDTMYSWAIHGRRPHDTPEYWFFGNVPDSWWAPYVDLFQHLHLCREPWQEKEVSRLVSEHGRAKFDGLDLFGVV